MAHPAFRTPTRYVVLALFGFLVLLGIAFVGAGATAVADGDEDSWLAIAGGLQFAVLGALGWFGLRPYRGPPPAAEQADGAVALPLRPGHARRLASGTVVASTLPLSLALARDGVWLVVGAVALVLGLALAGWQLTRGAAESGVLLDPDGISVPGGAGSRHRIAWRDLEGAEAVPRWQPLLVLIPKRDRQQMAGFRLLPQGWPPESLISLVEYYAGHAGRRAELTSAAEVDRFRG